MTKKEIIGICEFLKIHHFENAYTLLDYIDNLQKKAELGEHYKHLYSEVKKQKDDVVKLIYKKMRDVDIYGTQTFDLEELLRMLGEIDE